MLLNKRVGRPLGDVAEAVLSELAKQSMTVEQLVVSLQATHKMIAYTCHRLVNRRQIRIVERIRVKGCCKPVNRYALVHSLSPETVSNVVWGKE